MRKRSFLRLLALSVVVIILLIPAMPAAAAPLHQSGSTHVVQVGETLSAIAQRYGISQSALARANGITNPNFIWVGQRLTIPGAGGSSGGQSGYSSGRYSGSVHIVQRGEGLGSIAARYGTSANAIARANGISNPNLIYVGQRLTIPSGGGSSAGTSYGGGAYSAAPAPQAAVSGGRRWVDIDLSSQMITAYEGNTPVFQRLVSTGLNPTPTPVGTHSVSWKLPSQRMTGPGYDLPNVPHVMYFTNRGHAIHGAYWHNNFGQPMSHGCVNMRPGDAQWLYNFAPVGTTVVVHR